MRLIDADAMIHDITKLYCEYCEKRKGIKKGKLKFVYEIGDAPCRACQLDDMKDALENAPTVDAERHGHWIPVNPDVYGAEQFECSVCGVYSGDGLCRKESDYEYCPNCGAKMDEVEEK